jgi:tetratricopeptide (TPR) repeat protein
MKKAVIILIFILIGFNLFSQTIASEDSLKKWHRAASKYTRMENYSEALKYCNMLINAEPKNCKYLGLKAAIFNMSGQYLDAEKTLLNLLSYGCDSIMNYTLLSNIEKYQKNYLKAIDYMDIAIKLKPDSAELYIEKAQIYTILRDKENDIKCLQKAKSLGSKRAEELLEILEHPEK